MGSGRIERSGSKPAMISWGMGLPRMTSISRSSLCSSTHTKRDGQPGRAGPAGPPDAMDVVGGDHRQLVVHDVRQLVDVEAARGDLGGDQDGRPAGLEVGQGAHALSLAAVAVDGRGADALALELLGEAVGTVLGAGEHERLVDDAGLDQVRQQLALALAVDQVHDLGDQRRGRVAGRDLDRRRVVQEAAGQLPDLVREGGAEEQVLATGGQQREDLADVADEAHVEHPVGLVEDEDLDRRQVDGPLADVVEQAAGGGHDDIRRAAQGADLAVDADATVDGRRADAPVAAVDAHALLDLERELAGRGEDQRADGPAAGARVAVRRAKVLEHGQHEGRRLAGAGLGAGHQVAAGEDERDRLGLDGGGLGVALVRDGAEEFGLQPEGIEGHGEYGS